MQRDFERSIYFNLMKSLKHLYFQVEGWHSRTTSVAKMDEILASLKFWDFEKSCYAMIDLEMISKTQSKVPKKAGSGVQARFSRPKSPRLDFSYQGIAHLYPKEYPI